MFEILLEYEWDRETNNFLNYTSLGLRLFFYACTLTTLGATLGWLLAGLETNLWFFTAIGTLIFIGSNTHVTIINS